MEANSSQFKLFLTNIPLSYSDQRLEEQISRVVSNFDIQVKKKKGKKKSRMAVVRVFRSQDYENLLRTEFELDGVLCKVRRYLQPEQRVELNEARLFLRVYFSLSASAFTEIDANRLFSQFGPIDTIFFYPVRTLQEFGHDKKLFSGFVLFQTVQSAAKCLRAEGFLVYCSTKVQLFDHEAYQVQSKSRTEKIPPTSQGNKLPFKDQPLRFKKDQSFINLLSQDIILSRSILPQSSHQDYQIINQNVIQNYYFQKQRKNSQSNNHRNFETEKFSELDQIPEFRLPHLSKSKEASFALLSGNQKRKYDVGQNENSSLLGPFSSRLPGRQSLQTAAGQVNNYSWPQHNIQNQQLAQTVHTLEPRKYIHLHNYKIEDVPPRSVLQYRLNSSVLKRAR